MKIENELATIPSGGAYTAWGVTKAAVLAPIYLEDGEGS